MLKNYFIYFNILFNNTPYISSSILTFNTLNNTSLITRALHVGSARAMRLFIYLF